MMTSKSSRRAAAAALLLASAGLAASARAGEFYVGEPIERDGMQIVPNYLTGVVMEGHEAHAGSVGEVGGAPARVHLEADVHALRNNPQGIPEEAWVPYLTIGYRLEKVGGAAAKPQEGRLQPMTATDGPHYAQDVAMDGPGTYRLTYRFEPPSVNGFGRHVDRATGVPAWWPPFETTWTFPYPSKPKG